MTPLDAHDRNPALVDLYDSDSGWSADRDYYRALPVRAPMRILDLACGTGLLASAFAADGHVVTGVDPGRCFVFETRNPAMDWPTEWQGARTLRHRDRDIAQFRQIDRVEDEEISSITYSLPDAPRVSQSTPRFAPLETLIALAKGAGLQVAQLAGVWGGAKFDHDRSDEIILHLVPA